MGKWIEKIAEAVARKLKVGMKLYRELKTAAGPPFEDQSIVAIKQRAYRLFFWMYTT
jgi:hypothetical protein